MPTDFAFRLSTYLTLILSCLTLAYAEWDFLPEATIFTLFVAVMMVVAFHRDGRAELSLTAANRLGMIIGIIATVWIAFQFVRPSGGLIYTLPWPASMLPYLGPLIMVLMPAKLVRPKHLGDWWTMHGIALATVALACSMADDAIFGTLAGLYLICVAWSLSLFFLRRSAGTLAPIPGREANSIRPLVVTGELPTAPKTMLGRAFAARPLWAMGTATLLALVAFISTPRIDGPRWSLTRYREVGFGDDSPDLNRSGELKSTNRDVAFEVIAREADGTPKTDLPDGQRWRGRAYMTYDSGKWSANIPPRDMFVRGIQSIARGPGDPGLPAPESLPGAYSLEFRWKARKRDAVVADPVQWSPERPSPIISLLNGFSSSWTQLQDTTFFPLTIGPLNRYRQLMIPIEDPDLGPEFELSIDRPNPTEAAPIAGKIGPIGTSDNINPLTFTKLAGTKEYARTLLGKLARESKLPVGWDQRLDSVTRLPHPADHEAIARAFCRFLSESPEFEYSLTYQPADRSIDPVDDFLLNVRSGSCERFASALTHMLRSIGIPCRMVIGFKGYEYLGDGRYAVRQDHAHAWVETLISRPGSTPDQRIYHWLSLDPTPGGGDAAMTVSTSLTSSVSSLWQEITVWFNELIVRFDPDRRARLIETIIKWLSGHAVTMIGLGITIIASFFGWRRYRSWALRRKIGRPLPVSLPAWYRDLQQVLAKIGLQRADHETVREYLSRIEATWPELKEFQILINHFESVRYGNLSIDDRERQMIAGAVQSITSRLGFSSRPSSFVAIAGDSR